MANRVGIMLPTKIDEKIAATLPSIVYAQPKLNGLRCRSIINSQCVKMLSSQGNEIKSTPTLLTQLKDLHLKTGDTVLDGELYIHGEAFQTICHYAKRQTPLPDEYRICLHVYDIIDSRQQIARITDLKTIQSFIFEQQLSNIEVVETLTINTKDWTAFCSHYVEQGYEGIILRYIYGLYETKRSKNILKYKPTKTLQFPVTAFIEASDQYGEAKGMLGAVTCSQGKIGSFNCGAFTLGHDAARSLWDEYLEGNVIPQEFVALVRFPEYTINGHPHQPVLRKLVSTKTERVYNAISQD